MFEYEAGSLRSTPTSSIEDLPMMLQESKGQPRRVVIEGVVACSEPIETKHTSSASKVVAYSLTEIAHYAIRGVKFHTTPRRV
eukprot:1368703-Amorphochlora_amoeboformis.AAC.3